MKINLAIFDSVAIIGPEFISSSLLVTSAIRFVRRG
jgi:hypothetical protein